MHLGAFSMSLSVKDLAASRAFYEKLGYELFGVLRDYPRGTDRFFMMKRLGGGATEK
jgi:predicted lactoylglutathione lyase